MGCGALAHGVGVGVMEPPFQNGREPCEVRPRAARGKVKGSDSLVRATWAADRTGPGPGSTRQKPPTGSEALRTAQAAACCPTEGTRPLHRMLTQRSTRPPRQGGHRHRHQALPAPSSTQAAASWADSTESPHPQLRRDQGHRGRGSSAPSHRLQEEQVVFSSRQIKTNRTRHAPTRLRTRTRTF